jgi:integrase
MSDPVKTPSYRLHKQSGQAIVTIVDKLGGRKDVLLGKHGTEESHEKYRRVLAEWLQRGQRLPQPEAGDTITINELLNLYREHVEDYYKGSPEIRNVRDAFRSVRLLYGTAQVKDFAPTCLETVRTEMIGAGLCRSRINKDINRIRAMFEWAVAKTYIHVTIWQALTALKALKAGRSAARETEPVRPVNVVLVEATIPFLSPQVVAMVKLQLYTAMRPGEVCAMRSIDIDTTGKDWLYRPGSDQGPHGKHKTAHHGKNRIIPIGPKGQAVLKEWMRLNLTEYLFQPREAEAWRHARRRAARKSKPTPKQLAAMRSAKRSRAKEMYNVSAYDSSVAKACDRAGVDRWHPNQLRHTAATLIRKETDLETARTVLGHSSAATTEGYALADLAKASAVIAKIG